MDAVQVGNDTLLALRVASHPDRLENLYFAYLFVLRSVVKLSSYLPAYDLSTGNAEEDARVEVRRARDGSAHAWPEECMPAHARAAARGARGAGRESMQELVRSIVTFSLTCPPTFDEHSVFTSPDAERLKNEMRAHFRNISRIMDCVGCEKCRLWGKLQVTGTLSRPSAPMGRRGPTSLHVWADGSRWQATGRR